MFTFYVFQRVLHPALFLKVKNVPCFLKKIKIAPCPFLDVKNAPCLFLEMKNKPALFPPSVGQGRESWIPDENRKMLFEKYTSERIPALISPHLFP